MVPLQHIPTPTPALDRMWSRRLSWWSQALLVPVAYYIHCFSISVHGLLMDTDGLSIDYPRVSMHDPEGEHRLGGRFKF